MKVSLITACYNSAGTIRTAIESVLEQKGVAVEYIVVDGGSNDGTVDIVKEYATATDPMKATLSTLSKQLGMNFNKMDPAEVQFFTTLVEKYSTVYRSMLPKKGRGKK